MIKAIVLDFDGVVVESEGIKKQAFYELFRDYPEHIDEIMSYNTANVALSRYIKFEYIVTHILKEKYDEDKKRVLDSRFSSMVLQKIIKCPYVAGAEEFLYYFSARVPLYVASSTPQGEVEIITRARGIDKYFKEVYGAPRDKREVIKKVISGEKIERDVVAYIGDRREDYRVARDTGVLFVGRMNDEKLDDLGVPVFPDLSGVKDYLQNMVSNEALSHLNARKG